MKTRTTTILIISAILTLGLAVFYYFAVSYVGGLGGQTTDLNSDLMDTQLRYLKALSLQSIVNSGAGDTQQLSGYFLPAGKQIDAVKQFESLADQLSLEHTTEVIETQDIDQLSGQNKDLLHIVISTSGSLASTKKFLQLIESIPYNTQINQVTIMETSSDPKNITWSGRFDFSIVENEASSSAQTN
jgi:hypothetical protein